MWNFIEFIKLNIYKCISDLILRRDTTFDAAVQRF